MSKVEKTDATSDAISLDTFPTFKYYISDLRFLSRNPYDSVGKSN